MIWASTAAAADQCSEDFITVEGDWGRAGFDVRLARDNHDRSRGLMFVEEMPSRDGMLFLYPTPQRVGFWMKNTLIPLDMLFVDAGGVVTHIHENAVPGDLTLIPGGDRVIGVLEINGGVVSRFGITTGSKIVHPYFDDAASWPCEVK